MGVFGRWCWYFDCYLCLRYELGVKVIGGCVGWWLIFRMVWYLSLNRMMNMLWRLWIFYLLMRRLLVYLKCYGMGLFLWINELLLLMCRVLLVRRRILYCCCIVKLWYFLWKLLDCLILIVSWRCIFLVWVGWNLSLLVKWMLLKFWSW